MPKKMCKLAKKDKLKKTARRAADPRYICKKCLRVAHKKKHLCKPRELEST
jgi:hypothetical protein